MYEPFTPPQPQNAFLTRVTQVATNGGTVLIGVGLALILFAWYQISGETEVAAQVPYIVSGALFGLGLIIAGSAVLIVQAMSTTRLALVEAMAAAAVAQAPSTAGAAGFAPENAAGLVVAGASSYHLPDCKLVEGRDSGTLLTAGEAAGRGLTACRVCRPEMAPQVHITTLHA